MKNSKLSRFFGRGRKWVFTLALFLLVFAAASVVKIHAAGNVTGWLWGGSEDANIGGSLNTWPPDGNETGVGEIRMSGTAQNGSPYGVNIPSSDGSITGGNNFAWSENIGWIDFDGVNVTTVGNERRLSGQARVIAIRDAGANAGGWQGWIKMAGDGDNWSEPQNKCTGNGNNNYNNNSRCNYGVKIDASGNFSGYGWNGEESGVGANTATGLGYINFAKAKYTIPCTPVAGGCGSAISQTYCPDASAPNSNLCNAESALQGTVSGGGAPWSWKCVNSTCPGTVANCTTAATQPPVNGQCGGADGGSFCSNTPTDAEMCTGGTHPAAASLNLESYEVTWTCTGICSTVNDSCSAKGKKACGWIETNP